MASREAVRPGRKAKNQDIVQVGSFCACFSIFAALCRWSPPPTAETDSMDKKQTLTTRNRALDRHFEGNRAEADR